MIVADQPNRRSAKLVIVDADGGMRHLPRRELGSLFNPGDLVVANDAATLPASLHGTHSASGEPIEVRLAAWVSVGDPTQFVAIAFGAGDFRARTEDRPPPPSLSPGDRVSLGPLVAVVERFLNHPGLFRLRFLGDRATILRGLARHGHPIQYAHVREPLALWDVWTRIAADPIAFEPPSAGFALDWRYSGGLARTWGRFRHAYPRRRHFLDRRSDARPTAPFRRTLYHSGTNGGLDRAGAIEEWTRRRHRNDRGPRAGVGGKRRRQRPRGRRRCEWPYHP